MGARYIGGLFAASILLAGCSGSGYGDLENFTREVKARPPGRVEPVPEFRTYESVAYAVQEMRSPFDPVVSDASQAEAGTGDGIRPDQHRRRESLEAFPLDTLKFVGHLEQDGEAWAIVTAPDKLVYRVQEGNYLGQNHGRIDAVTETRVNLTEIVSDGRGSWIERNASLALAE